MKKTIRNVLLSSLLLVTQAVTSVASGEDLREQAQKAIGVLQDADSGLTNLFDKSAGFVVFPSVGKGGLFLGAAHGDGLVYEKGKPVGEATLTEVNVGPQVGGQSFYEVIFFQTPDDISHFKLSNLEMSAETSAVYVTQGASLNARYRDGVMVFTLTRGGLMVDASIGSQKLKYKPLE
jgi:lipid-binding SYLF domain-containing protein